VHGTNVKIKKSYCGQTWALAFSTIKLQSSTSTYPVNSISHSYAICCMLFLLQVLPPTSKCWNYHKRCFFSVSSIHISSL